MKWVLFAGESLAITAVVVSATLGVLAFWLEALDSWRWRRRRAS